MTKIQKSNLTSDQKTGLLSILKKRFINNQSRHPELIWEQVALLLERSGSKIWSLSEMERTGGDPDVVGFDERRGELLFMDCSPESPAGRRSICYDREALSLRKEFKPENNALDLADLMGIEILTEEQYRFLQRLGNFDTKTSSWIKTPAEIRKLGGALFCDRRYGQVFVYHNSAQSYYASRAFRGLLRI
jgi:hypothetical protein